MSAVLRAQSTWRWHPSALIAASIALHAVVATWLVADLAAWPIGISLVVLDHAVLAAIGMWPRSRLLGPNITRLPEQARRRGEIALTFDDGPDPEVTPLVLDILDRFGTRATFFCIARQAALHPELCREIARRGHMVENHSCGHLPTFAFLGLGGIRRELSRAQETLFGLTGRAPRFFRPPAGLRNPLLDPVLHALGLKLVSWTRRGFDTRKADAASVAAQLVHGLRPGDILLLHDGHCARTSDNQPVVVEVLPRVLEAARSQHLQPVTLDQAIAP